MTLFHPTSVPIQAEISQFSQQAIEATVQFIFEHSGYGKRLNLAGTVVMEIRFDANGSVVCARASTGHPLGVSAAMAAITKWTFKPIVEGGVRKSGCGTLTIKYHLQDKGSSTELK